MAIALGGCAQLFQGASTALIREPGAVFYNDEKPVGESAKEFWEYAAIAGLAYPRDDLTACASIQPPRAAHSAPLAARADAETLAVSNFTGVVSELQNLGWQKWPDFPDTTLTNAMKQYDLYVSVWEWKSSTQTIVVVAFKGTNPDAWPDWYSNFRWIFNLIPGHYDQYNEVLDVFDPAFVKAYAAHVPTGTGSQNLIFAAGHSLGGGLAQEFAYSIPSNDRSRPPSEQVPRVSKVFAFDPSPVTGYYSIAESVREAGAKGVQPDEKKGLEIGRILEKGEILSYLRTVTGLIYWPSAEDPAISGVRFDLFPSLSPIASHSMDELACKLYDAAAKAGPIAHYDEAIDGPLPVP